MAWLFLALIVVGAWVFARNALRRRQGPSTVTGDSAAPTPSSTRVVLAALAIFLGGVGTVLGAAIVIYALGFGRTEGDAMFAGAGFLMLLIAVPVLGLGLLLRPKESVNASSGPAA